LPASRGALFLAPSHSLRLPVEAPLQPPYIYRDLIEMMIGREYYQGYQDVPFLLHFLSRRVLVERSLPRLHICLGAVRYLLGRERFQMPRTLFPLSVARRGVSSDALN